MIIIGITGTLGAGKGTIVEYLIQKKNFLHFSVREYLLLEISKRGMPPNRDSMVVVANELRKTHSPAYIVEQLYLQAAECGSNCIIESIRTPDEVESLRKKGKFYLIAVDAKAEERYRRIQLRASETDHVSFEVFLQNEQREMESTDPNKQNIGRCIQMADFVVENNGAIRDLESHIEEILKKIA